MTAAMVIIGFWLGVLLVLVLGMTGASAKHEKRIAVIEGAIEELSGLLERVDSLRNVLGAVVSDPALLCPHGFLRGIPCADCEAATRDPRLEQLEDS